MSEKIIQETVQFVKKHLADAEVGHDWWHIERVWRNAKHIGVAESVDMFVVELGALLHDIADAKFHDGNEEIGPQIARDFLQSQGVGEDKIEHVENIIRHISFKSNIEGQKWMSPELAVVQDADRLDALGAVGIARAFTYGGFKNRPLFNPEIKPNLAMDKHTYQSSQGTTLNHFYEKLFLLKDLMNTNAGKKLSEERHLFMERYVEQFLAEWEGKK